MISKALLPSFLRFQLKYSKVFTHIIISFKRNFKVISNAHFIHLPQVLRKKTCGDCFILHAPGSSIHHRSPDPFSIWHLGPQPASCIQNHLLYSRCSKRFLQIFHIPHFIPKHLQLSFLFRNVPMKPVYSAFKITIPIRYLPVLPLHVYKSTIQRLNELNDLLKERHDPFPVCLCSFKCRRFRQPFLRITDMLSRKCLNRFRSACVASNFCLAFRTFSPVSAISLSSSAFTSSLSKTSVSRLSFCSSNSATSAALSFFLNSSTVDVRVTDTTIEIFYHHDRIASHRRLHGRSGQYSTVTAHMPDDHQKYLEWNGDRFRRWADQIGPNTRKAVDAILTSGRVEQQSYRSCMGLLRLADKHTSKRLEKACERALSYSGKPSYKSIKNLITATKQESDALPSDEETKPRGLTRGARYYGGNRS